MNMLIKMQDCNLKCILEYGVENIYSSVKKVLVQHSEKTIDEISLDVSLLKAARDKFNIPILS